MKFGSRFNNGIATPLLIGLVIVAILLSSGAIYVANSDDGVIKDNTGYPGDEDDDLSVGTKVGMKAPNFSLNNLQGENLTLNKLRGDVVIIDFMAMGCLPCKAELSHLKEVNQKYSDENLVDSSETEGKLENFAREYGAEWNFTISSDLGLRYRVLVIPTIYVLNKKGVIKCKSSGLTSASKLKSEIEAIL